MTKKEIIAAIDELDIDDVQDVFDRCDEILSAADDEEREDADFDEDDE